MVVVFFLGGGLPILHRFFQVKKKKRMVQRVWPASTNWWWVNIPLFIGLIRIPHLRLLDHWALNDIDIKQWCTMGLDRQKRAGPVKPGHSNKNCVIWRWASVQTVETNVRQCATLPSHINHTSQCQSTTAAQPLKVFPSVHAVGFQHLSLEECGKAQPKTAWISPTPSVFQDSCAVGTPNYETANAHPICWYCWFSPRKHIANTIPIPYLHVSIAVGLLPPRHSALVQRLLQLASKHLEVVGPAVISAVAHGKLMKIGTVASLCWFNLIFDSFYCLPCLSSGIFQNIYCYSKRWLFKKHWKAFSDVYSKTKEFTTMLRNLVATTTLCHLDMHSGLLRTFDFIATCERVSIYHWIGSLDSSGCSQYQKSGTKIGGVETRNQNRLIFMLIMLIRFNYIGLYINII